MNEYMGYDSDGMEGDEMEGDEMEGDEMEGDIIAGDEEILGAVRRRRPVRRPSRRLPPGRAPRRAQRPMVIARAEPPKKLRGYLGLGSVQFTSASGTQLSITVEPQRGFRPERLIVDRRDGSAVTAGIGARITNIFIGDQPQSPSVEQPAPTEMFARDATVSGIDFDAAVPGQKITIQYSLSAAPAGTEFVLLSAGFYGSMIRA